MSNRISIALATFNGSRYLQEQLDSYTRQTKQPDELVVCDDGSVDSTIEILQKFAATAPFNVHIYRNKNTLGHSRNFEKAISLCTGDLIFLSDQDDVWLPHKIERMSAILSKNRKNHLLVADLQITDQLLNPSNSTQLENLRSQGQSSRKLVTGCATLVTKKLVDLALPIPHSVTTHDTWLHELALLLGVRSIHCEVVQYYRRHNECATQPLSASTIKTDWRTTLKHHTETNSLDGWYRREERLKILKARISENTDLIKGLRDGINKKALVSDIEKDIIAIMRRKHVASISRWRRLPYVTLIFLTGGYRQFAGIKSAAKDLLRIRHQIRIS